MNTLVIWQYGPTWLAEDGFQARGARVSPMGAVLDAVPPSGGEVPRASTTSLGYLGKSGAIFVR